MFGLKDWAMPMLMLGFVVLGFVLATANTRRDYERQLHEQQAKYELEMVKRHMTTMLQLNDCYLNEAFYTLDREIFETKKRFEGKNLPSSRRDAYQQANKYILDYYERFGMHSTCDDCVPRSPMPTFKCIAA